MLQAVFFDLDETLIDAGKCHVEAGVRTFNHYGMDYLKAREITGNFLGIRMREIMAARRDAVGLTEAEAPAGHMNSMREKHYIDLITTHVALMPGAAEAVHAAAKAGAVVAVVSSETEPCIRAVLQHFGLARYVDYVVGGDHVTHGKPHPEPYELAFRRLQDHRAARKADCLAVEDSVVGSSAALGAGLPLCLVPMQPLSEPVAATYHLPDLSGFPALVERLARPAGPAHG